MENAKSLCIPWALFVSELIWTALLVLVGGREVGRGAGS
jgi:hypothetical protein